MTDLTELIVAEHERIRRLFSALEDVARYTSSQAGRRGPLLLEESWTRLAALITAHAEAERRVLYPALAAAGAGRPALPGQRSLLDCVEQVSRHAPGSPAWRRAVAVARAGTRAQFSAEEHVILDFRQRTDCVRREALGHQWAVLGARPAHGARRELRSAGLAGDWLRRQVRDAEAGQAAGMPGRHPIEPAAGVLERADRAAERR
jgi:hypothetical protein